MVACNLIKQVEIVKIMVAWVIHIFIYLYFYTKKKFLGRQNNI